MPQVQWISPIKLPPRKLTIVVELKGSIGSSFQNNQKGVLNRKNL